MKKNTLGRRSFISKMTAIAGGAALLPHFSWAAASEKKMFFDISLAQWSLHKTLFNKEITNLEFPIKTKRDFGINAVEYVSRFFDSTETPYLSKLLNITKDNEVENVLIMVDGEGHLGELDKKKRKQAVKNHFKWVEAAKYLGCHSIRVNAYGEGTADEVSKAVVDGLSRLSEYASKDGINVIVENHGGYSSNGKWLSNVMKTVNMPNCGTLPDFGNFKISKTETYDRYLGTKELMPFAKGVSAKSHDFDKDGNEIHTDYLKMLKIVKEAGYRGYVGVEYEGKKLSEDEGIMATKRLLEKVGKQLS